MQADPIRLCCAAKVFEDEQAILQVTFVHAGGTIPVSDQNIFFKVSLIFQYTKEAFGYLETEVGKVSTTPVQ